MKQKQKQKQEHGCLYTGFGLLALCVIVSVIIPPAGSIMTLLFVAYVLFTVVSSLFNSDPFAAQEQSYWKDQRVKQAIQFDNVYEVSDGTRKARIPARSSYDAQFRFVHRYGGMVELTFVRKVQ